MAGFCPRDLSNSRFMQGLLRFRHASSMTTKKTMPRFAAFPCQRWLFAGDSPDPLSDRLRLGESRNATMIPTGGQFDRGLGQGQPVELRAGRLVTGAGAKPAGKRLASEIGHRVDTAKEATGLSLHDGGKERVAVLCLVTRGAVRRAYPNRAERRTKGTEHEQ